MAVFDGGGVCWSNRDYTGTLQGDDYLRQKFGESVVEESRQPITYGNVNLSEYEEAALMLSPKFTVHEKIDIRDMELELHRTDVTIRWSIRSDEEGGFENEEDEVVSTNYWSKGM